MRFPFENNSQAENPRKKADTNFINVYRRIIVQRIFSVHLVTPKNQIQ